MQFFEDLSLHHILGPALSGISRQSLVKLVRETAMFKSVIGRSYKRNVRMAQHFRRVRSIQSLLCPRTLAKVCSTLLCSTDLESTMLNVMFRSITIYISARALQQRTQCLHNKGKLQKCTPVFM